MVRIIETAHYRIYDLELHNWRNYNMYINHSLVKAIMTNKQIYNVINIPSVGI